MYIVKHVRKTQDKL